MSHPFDCKGCGPYDYEEICLIGAGLEKSLSFYRDMNGICAKSLAFSLLVTLVWIYERDGYVTRDGSKALPSLEEALPYAREHLDRMIADSTKDMTRN